MPSSSYIYMSFDGIDDDHFLVMKNGLAMPFEKGIA